MPSGGVFSSRLEGGEWVTAFRFVVVVVVVAVAVVGFVIGAPPEVSIWI